jgi:quercetin dioxygenase-like cupin family protein
MRSFLHSVAVLCCSAATLFAAPAETARPLLGSMIYDFTELAVRPTAVGLRRDVVNRPTATLQRFQSHITTLNPGLASHGQHQHPLEEMILVKEGTLEVVINGRAETAGPGSVLFYASNDFHHVRNIGTVPATYIVLNFGTAATATAPATRAVDSAPPKALKSQVFEWTRLAAVPTKNGERRAIFNSPTVTCRNLSCHATTVQARDAAHGAHRHVDEEVVVVKEGTIEIFLNGATRRIGPGSICFFASNDEHGMRNVGDTPATYYVIRVITEATPAPPPKAAK